MGSWDRAVMRTRRKKPPIVEVSIESASLHVKTDQAQLDVELRRELGGSPQIEIAFGPASTSEGSALPSRVPTTSTLVFRREQPCIECRRRGYHLKRCSRRGDK